jgi:trans-2,3-dihydro-3-hydroxyanthranilate isomerase
MAPADMQAVAATFGFSESTFVTSVTDGTYDVRIFTPEEELDFAGHPTLGTAWYLRHRGLLEGDRCVQGSSGGPTQVSFEHDLVWFARAGSCGVDIDARTAGSLAKALGIDPSCIGYGAVGGGAHLQPAFSDAGLRQLMVPVRDTSVLESIVPDPELLAKLTDTGAYVFTPVGPRAIRARGFFSPVGVPEDAATGSAAAGLGLYLADRLGDQAAEVTQGVEMDRPSALQVRASPGAVRVGGRCGLVMEGELVAP